MDQNKLKVLRDEGYQIAPSCGFCAHRSFAVGSQWGTCEVSSYDHAKHNEVRRQLSIHRGGWCQRFEIDQREVDMLGGFAQLFDPHAGAAQAAAPEAPVIPLVTAAQREAAIDARYYSAARHDVRLALQEALEKTEAEPTANIAIAFAYEDGAIGTVIATDVNLPLMLGAVAFLQLRCGMKMEPPSGG